MNNNFKFLQNANIWNKYLEPLRKFFFANCSTPVDISTGEGWKKIARKWKCFWKMANFSRYDNDFYSSQFCLTLYTGSVVNLSLAKMYLQSDKWGLNKTNSPILIQVDFYKLWPVSWIVFIFPSKIYEYFKTFRVVEIAVIGEIQYIPKLEVTVMVRTETCRLKPVLKICISLSI